MAAVNEIPPQQNTIVVNLPLSELRKLISDQRDQFVESIATSSEGGDVIVVCRRGIDSLVGTRLLKEAGVQNVFNLNGGLTAWKTEIDKEFPMY